jgi:hypothetical protein
LNLKVDEKMKKEITTRHELERERSYRRKILTELKKIHDKKGPDSYILTTNLKTFRPGDQQYLKAVNQLLNEDLIKAISSENLSAIAINPFRIAHIRMELNSWHTIPRFWITSLIAVAVLALAMIIFFI